MPPSSKQKPGATKFSRPPFERMQRIHQALIKGDYPNCSRLAKSLEVSIKTVQRDIDFMRDRQSLPIEFDRRKNGFYYSKPVESLPSVQVSEGEVVALYIAQKVLEQYRGTSFEKPLAAAFDKLTAGLQDSISFPLETMDDAISFRATGVAEANLEIFQTLHEAITAREEVVITYKSLKDRAAKSRWVQPYHLLGASNTWYLIGFDMEREALRVFALPRIRSAKRTGRTFVRNLSFNPQHLLQGSLGIFIGKESHRIRIRFDSFAAQLIREKHWHDSQKIVELPDDELEMEMTLNSLFEVERWILSWGPHAEVLEPLHFREQILAKAESMVATYSGKPGTGPLPPTLWEYAGLSDAVIYQTTDPREASRERRRLNRKRTQGWGKRDL
jgi:predicted DNA-binding transcriptional regulator YafY